MGDLYYAKDLLRGDIQEGFSASLTISGLISHGAERYPLEWAAIISEHASRAAVVTYAVNNEPVHDGTAGMFERMAKGLARL